MFWFNRGWKPLPHFDDERWDPAPAGENSIISINIQNKPFLPLEAGMVYFRRSNLRLKMDRAIIFNCAWEVPPPI